MAAWDIDPVGVAGVVATTQGIADGLDEDGRAIRTEVGGAVPAAGPARSGRRWTRSSPTAPPSWTS